MGPSRITFTGVDPSCSRAELFALLDADPRIELGFLYSVSREGTGRYPPFAWIEDSARDIFHAFGPRRAALHVCGRARGDLIDGKGLAFDCWSFQRVQLNGAFIGGQRDALRRFIADSAPDRCITQFDANPQLHIEVGCSNHQVLFDASGGRGILRDAWPKAFQNNVCGYAGGLGPDNLRAELPRIAAVAGPDYWVDMEGSLRDGEDHFDIEKARRALDAILETEGTVEEANRG